MTDQKQKAEQFRALDVLGKRLVLFSVWDGGSAKSVVGGGVKAVATSSWSVANANGFTDGERIPLVLVIDNLRLIVGAINSPGLASGSAQPGPIPFGLVSYGEQPD